MNIEIIAAGAMKDKHQLALINTYLNRMKWAVTITEIAVKHSKKATTAEIKKAEEEQFLKTISPNSYLIALDENGKDLTSIEFSKKLEEIKDNPAFSKICIIIGGAYGFSKEILQKADLTLRFGRLTWPHMLVRIMIAEQLYRAEQIFLGHPYHKE